MNRNMPPKAAGAEPVVEFIFEKDRMIRKFNVDNYVTRSKVEALDVPRRPVKEPSEKLKERLNTYRNIRRMRTDYKNYVHKYGTPNFYVPEELWRN